MADTFLDMVNEVLDEIDEDQITDLENTANNSVETRRVMRYLNKSYKEIFDERPDWSWARHKDSFTTVAGQADYATGLTAFTIDSSCDLQKIHLVQVTGYPPMKLMHYAEFKRCHGEFESVNTGVPYVAYELDGKLWLYPTPDAAMTVNYIMGKVFSRMTLNTSEPYLPDQKRTVLVDGALWRAMKHENDPDVKLQLEIYQAGRQRLRNAEGHNNDGFAIIPEADTITAEEDWTILLE